MRILKLMLPLAIAVAGAATLVGKLAERKPVTVCDLPGGDMPEPEKEMTREPELKTEAPAEPEMPAKTETVTRSPEFWHSETDGAVDINGKTVCPMGRFAHGQEQALKDFAQMGARAVSSPSGRVEIIVIGDMTRSEYAERLFKSEDFNDMIRVRAKRGLEPAVLISESQAYASVPADA